MLIDGGDVGSGNLEYLRAHGVQRIQLMVSTHPHTDHIGGLIDVLEAIPVDQVVTNGYSYTTQVYEQFLDAIAAARVPYREVSSGSVLRLSSVEFAVLNPVARKEYSGINQSSIVLRLQFGSTTFLFTGDAGSQAEHDMLAAGLPLGALVLKVGHHGSYTASSPEFLQAVRPEIAIYSVGKNNPYGHPHRSTLEHLVQAGARIYGTDLDGTMVVTANRSGYTVSTAGGASPQTQPLSPTAASSAQPVVPTNFSATLTPVFSLQTTVPTVIPSLTATAIAQPTGSGISSDLQLDVVSLTSPTHRNSTARLEIKTLPNAQCTITVLYKSGPSKAAGLDPQVDDKGGKAA